MFKCGITLVSRQTGEEKHFESIFLATCFLNRGTCYINNMMAYGGIVTHGDTGEAYDVIREVPKIGKIECNSLNQAKMLEKSICNGCARSVGFCSWSESFEPVKGWKAEDSFDVDGSWYSYCVRECPLFMKDAPTPKGRKEQRRQLLKESLNGIEAEGKK